MGGVAGSAATAACKGWSRMQRRWQQEQCITTLPCCYMPNVVVACCHPPPLTICCKARPRAHFDWQLALRTPPCMYDALRACGALLLVYFVLHARMRAIARQQHQQCCCISSRRRTRKLCQHGHDATAALIGQRAGVGEAHALRTSGPLVC